IPSTCSSWLGSSRALVQWSMPSTARRRSYRRASRLSSSCVSPPRGCCFAGAKRPEDHGDMARTAGRAGLHLRHRAARYACARSHHARAPAARRDVRRRRHRAGGRALRAGVHAVRGHAVRGVARARRALRPLWPPSDRPAVERRARPRLHRHGARAERRLAPGWARVVRAHLREHHGRGCLRRRRHRGARARRRLCDARRGVRPRLRVGAGSRRAARLLDWGTPTASPKPPRSRVGFWVAAYGLLVLPESLAPERRARVAWRRANPVGALVILRGRPALRGLAAMMFLRHVAHAALPSTFVLYATYRYGWDAKAVGLALAGVGVGSLIVQGALVAPFVRRFGETAALLWGLAFG